MSSCEALWQTLERPASTAILIVRMTAASTSSMEDVFTRVLAPLHEYALLHAVSLAHLRLVNSAAHQLVDQAHRKQSWWPLLASLMAEHAGAVQCILREQAALLNNLLAGMTPALHTDKLVQPCMTGLEPCGLIGKESWRGDVGGGGGGGGERGRGGLERAWCCFVLEMVARRKDLQQQICSHKSHTREM